MVRVVCGMGGAIMGKFLVMTIAIVMLISSMPGAILGALKDSSAMDASVMDRPVLNAGPMASLWPMFRHDLNHTGRSDVNTSTNKGYKIWEFATGGSCFSSPAVDTNGTLYFGSTDRKMYAVYPNGTKKWEFKTNNVISASPTVDTNGTIYFGSQDFRFYALYPNGTKKWDYLTGDIVYASPTVAPNGMVYVGSHDKKFYAFYPNGTKKWEFLTGNQIWSSAAIDQNGTVYFGSNDGKLYSVYPNGTMKWSFTTGNAVKASPAIGPDGTIYFGSEDQKEYALFPNGTKRWEYPTGHLLFSSTAIGKDGVLYFGDEYPGNLYALYPNGTKKWTFAAKDTIWSSPAISSDGTIYVGSRDHHLYALNPDGSKQWSFLTGDGVSSSPTIGANGTVYFDSFDNKLYALGVGRPNATLGLYAVASNARVDLAWSTPDTDGGAVITNYTVYRGTSPGTETLLKRIGALTGYADTAVTNGQTYYYVVTASNFRYEGPRSNEVNATPMAMPMAPRNLTAVPGDAMIALNWTAPAYDGGMPIINYTIYRNGVLLKNLGPVLTDTNTGLTNGVKYTYNVSATTSAGEGPRSIGASAVPRTVPTAPRDLSATSKGMQIELVWSAPASNGGVPVLNYSIYRGNASGNEAVLAKGLNGTSWVDTNVSLGNTYYYMVSALNIAGEGPRSNEQNASPYAVPSAPVLTVSTGFSNVTLAWTVPVSNGSPIVNYSIYRGSRSGNETLLLKGYTKGLSFVDLAVLPGTTYFYQVSAANKAGEGPRSLERNATPYGLPGAPVLTAIPGGYRVVLNWTVPSSNGSPILSYNIYRGNSTGTGALLVKGFIGLSWTDYVSTGQAYFYSVSAVNLAGEGPRSNEEKAGSFGVPAAPVLSARSGLSDITLTWTEPDNHGSAIRAYNIFRGTNTHNESILVKNYILGMTYVDRNITGNDTYYYRVCAVNAAGEGLMSNERDGSELPGPPIGLKVTAGDRSISLRWTAPMDGGKVVKYNIYRSDSKNGNYVLLGTSTTTQYKDTGLTNGRTYWYKMNAQNIRGVSANTTAASGTTYGTSSAGGPFTLFLIVAMIAIVIVVMALAFFRKGLRKEERTTRKKDEEEEQEEEDEET
jgi:outer membrane protein assembly factor BamB/fibronectin type 3 domain-containing protein